LDQQFSSQCNLSPNHSQVVNMVFTPILEYGMGLMEILQWHSTQPPARPHIITCWPSQVYYLGADNFRKLLTTDTVDSAILKSMAPTLKLYKNHQPPWQTWRQPLCHPSPSTPSFNAQQSTTHPGNHPMQKLRPKCFGVQQTSIDNNSVLSPTYNCINNHHELCNYHTKQCCSILATPNTKNYNR